MSLYARSTGSGLISGGGGGGTTVTIGAFSSTPSSPGLTLSLAGVLNMDPADGTHPGGVSTGAQSFGGAKTFLSTVSASQFISTIATGTAPLVVASTTLVPNLYVAHAVLADTTTNLVGGAGGSVPYQSAANTTAFLANGSAGQVLTSAGTTLAPTWTTPTTGTVTAVSVASANGFAGTSSGGATPALTLSTTLNTPVIAGNGTALVAATTTGTGSTVVLNVAPTFTGTVTGAILTLANGTGGSVGTPALYLATDSTTGVYRPGVNQFGITVAGAAVGIFGTSGLSVTGALSATTTVTATTQLISSVATGTAPLVVSSTTQVANLNAATAGSATTATTATNLAGGANGSLPYQTASGTTTMLAAGSNTNVLTLAGGVPTWAAPATAGTVTAVSVASANGFAGTSSGGATPALTLSTTITGVLQGNGTAISAIAASSTPTASALAKWDANVNMSANNFIEGFRTQATANSTLTLVVGDAFQQFFTGSTAGQIVLLPTTGIVAGQSFQLVNISSASVTVQSSGANTIQVMAANTQLLVTALVATPTTAANWNATYQATTITAPVNPTVQKFTSGSGTYTTPTGVQYIRVRMVGAGGGGGGGGATGGTGGTGGNTTFGTTLLVSNGGVGGVGVGGSGGAGGTASLGSGPIGTALSGGYGQGAPDTVGLTSSGFGGGIGAASFFGGSGAASVNGQAGTAGVTNTGAGGQGGAGTTSAIVPGAGGGAGGFVDAIISSPSATYSYAVGAAGTAGGAGTNGTAGGLGGSGYIEVIEYYSNVAISATTSVSAGTYYGGPYSGSATTPSFKAFQAPTKQTFLSSTGTYTTPPGVLWLRVRGIGAGGGAGGSGTGAPTAGGTGGITTFGTSLLTGNGGVGGATPGGVASAGGTASVTASGTVLQLAALQGGSGTMGIQAAGTTSVPNQCGGSGGNGYFGGGGGGVYANVSNPGATNTGGGGGASSGATNVNAIPPGNGGGAGGYFEAIISAPSASYGYAVGAAGTAGGAGTNGVAGAIGGSGIIIVEEYYQ